MAGIAGMGAAQRDQALGGLKRAADLEEARKLTGMQMRQAYRQQQLSGAMSGVGAGAMIGSIVPGVGTAVGALVGGIIGGVVGYGAASYA